MLERAESWLKGLTAALLVLLVMQGSGLVRRLHPLRRTAVPEPASWSASAPTNAPSQSSSNAPASAGTNAKPATVAGPVPPPPERSARPGRGMPGMGGPGGPGPALPPEIQARVDRVVQSEILGMIVRPPPMALLGIVGKDVLLRAPNGMSGLVREGGELGGVQIVRIGTNRVLVKEDGVEKELTIFGGMGGESLMSTTNQTKP